MRAYSPLFRRKYKFLQNSADKRNIREYVTKIANHPEPDNIGGCASCSDGVSTKLKFTTGWVIIYQKRVSEIYFLGFYKEKID